MSGASGLNYFHKIKYAESLNNKNLEKLLLENLQDR